MTAEGKSRKNNKSVVCFDFAEYCAKLLFCSSLQGNPQNLRKNAELAKRFYQFHKIKQILKMDCHENPCGFSRNDDSIPSYRLCEGVKRPKQSIESTNILGNIKIIELTQIFLKPQNCTKILAIPQNLRK